MTTNPQTHIIEVTVPATSNAHLKDLEYYLNMVVAKDEEDNNGNTNFKGNVDARAAKREHVTHEGIGSDPLKPRLAYIRMILPLDPVNGGQHLLAHNSFWNGPTYSQRPKSPDQLKMHHMSIPLEEVYIGPLDDEPVTNEGERHYLYWEFPVMGKASAMFEKEQEAKVKSTREQMRAEVARRMSDNS